jgi:hypothetical protein
MTTIEIERRPGGGIDDADDVAGEEEDVGVDEGGRGRRSGWLWGRRRRTAAEDASGSRSIIAFFPAILVVLPRRRAVHG